MKTNTLSYQGTARRPLPNKVEDHLECAERSVRSFVRVILSSQNPTPIYWYAMLDCQEAMVAAPAGSQEYRRAKELADELEALGKLRRIYGA